MTLHSVSAETVNDFWFGAHDTLDANGLPSQAIQTRWWKKDAEFDNEIKTKFLPAMQAVTKEPHLDWLDSAHSRLAAILLIDQFRRNVFRDQATAFEFDSLCQTWTIEGINLGMDQALSPIERVFFYLPLEHAENPDLQAHCVALFKALHDTVDPVIQPVFANFLDFAQRHKTIIDRFGHFPHRNSTVGRTSTEEELAFLEQPNSSF